MRCPGDLGTLFGMSQHSSGVVTDQEGTLHWLGGISARLMLSGNATGGRFSVIEHRLGPRELGAPMHLHAREDEYSIVTDGVVGFVLGDDVVTAEPGSLVRKPRNQWHTFYNAGDATLTTTSRPPPSRSGVPSHEHPVVGLRRRPRQDSRRSRPRAARQVPVPPRTQATTGAHRLRRRGHRDLPHRTGQPALGHRPPQPWTGADHI